MRRKYSHLCVGECGEWILTEGTEGNIFDLWRTMGKMGLSKMGIPSRFGPISVPFSSTTSRPNPPQPTSRVLCSIFPSFSPISPHFPPFPPISPHFSPFSPIFLHFPPFAPISHIFPDSKILVWWVGDFGGSERGCLLISTHLHPTRDSVGFPSNRQRQCVRAWVQSSRQWPQCRNTGHSGTEGVWTRARVRRMIPEHVFAAVLAARGCQAHPLAGLDWDSSTSGGMEPPPPPPPPSSCRTPPPPCSFSPALSFFLEACPRGALHSQCAAGPTVNGSKSRTPPTFCSG